MNQSESWYRKRGQCAHHWYIDHTHVTVDFSLCTRKQVKSQILKTNPWFKDSYYLRVKCTAFSESNIGLKTLEYAICLHFFKWLRDRLLEKGLGLFLPGPFSPWDVLSLGRFLLVPLSPWAILGVSCYVYWVIAHKSCKGNKHKCTAPMAIFTYFLDKLGFIDVLNVLNISNVLTSLCPSLIKQNPDQPAWIAGLNTLFTINCKFKFTNSWKWLHDSLLYIEELKNLKRQVNPSPRVNDVWVLGTQLHSCVLFTSVDFHVI